MAVRDAQWKPEDDAIEARRAPVPPRVSLHPGQASLPIDQQVRKLLEGRVIGAVCLSGESGSGKTTALRHLAAALSNESKVRLVDRPLAGDRPVTQPGQLIVYTSPIVADPGKCVLLKMTPWGTDDLIEYLLATHPGRCRAVMDRVKTDSQGVASLRGLPELWRIVLDEMAADDAVLTVEAALLRHLSRTLPTSIDWEVVGRKCLTLIAPWGKTWIQGPPCDPQVSRLIRHPTVSLMLAARELARGLADGTVDAELRGTLPGNLIDRCGQILIGFPTATERLKDMVSGDDRHLHAMAASLLHAAGDPWRPFQRPGMDLSGARLSGAQWPGVELPKSRMCGIDMAQAVLDESELGEVSLERAKLRAVSLRKANLNSARLSGADLRKADLAFSLANEARFLDADLTDAEFHRAILHDALFRGAKLTRTQFIATDLTGADFRHTVLDETDFTGSTLDRVKLRNLPLESCTFNGARLNGADLRQCNLEGLSASGVDFSNAKLKHALLTGSIFDKCMFYRADLRNCGLADINWEGADLRHADLRRSTFHMGSTRSGLVFSTTPGEGSRTGFYTDDFHDRQFKNPEEIRKANLCNADMRGAKLDYVDFYLVDLRGARYSKKQRDWFLRCCAILRD
jgi:uncharacterized protein YjbI with pentapeptide repeats